jgi:hypothetical protein
MLSEKTQKKLDRASEGLPMDDEMQQIEAAIEVINSENATLERLIGSIRERKRREGKEKEMSVATEMDDDSGERTLDDIDKEKAEQQLFNDHD